jgi:microcystin-dependent protein
MAKTSGYFPVLAIALAIGVCAPQARAEPVIGEIKTFAFNYCPTNTVEATGQTKSISRNTTLFAVIGNTFGVGPNAETFKLPDLAGRAMIGVSDTTVVGAKAGAAKVNLTRDQLPIVEGLKAAYADGAGLTRTVVFGVAHHPNVSAVSIMPPYLALTQCVVIEGSFPTAP